MQGSKSGIVGFEVHARSYRAQVMTVLAKKVGEILEDAAEEFVRTMEEEALSLTDHKQEDLDAMGNPYRVGPPPGPMIHHPHWWSVHTQTGEMLRDKPLFWGFPNNEAGKIEVAVHLNTSSEHAVKVHQGDELMQPRPFLFYGFAEYGELALRLAVFSRYF